MRHQGKLTSWDDDRGFGFITPADGSARVFLHIRSLHRDASRPVAGDLITYTLDIDERGRPRAKAALKAGEKLTKPQPDGRGWKAPAFVLAFLCAILVAIGTERLPPSAAIFYLVAGLVTFLAYWHDKGKARAGSWRTAESTLHMLGLLGGWPGGFVAQRVLRHKSVKQAFQFVFWLTAVLHCALLAWFMSLPGRAWIARLGL